MLFRSAVASYEKTRKQFDDVLKQQGFVNEEVYQKAYMPRLEIEAQMHKVTEFEQNTSILKALYEEASKRAIDMELQDVEALEKQVQLLQEEHVQLVEQVTSIRERILHNEQELKNIEKSSNKNEQKEKEYAIVAELENVASGDTANKKRITFESYVLTAYFDEIIFAANKRLDKMSYGRYQLRRKEELAKGKGKQGLELEVMDYHTGKSRDVKTLSGGEGFKAALALALGLADVIQGHAGGVSIETMFIDEGFGTLDPTSLDIAIECLLGLQHGVRLIGIISHVPELTERIEVDRKSVV